MGTLQDRILELSGIDPKTLTLRSLATKVIDLQRLMQDQEKRIDQLTSHKGSKNIFKKSFIAHLDTQQIKGKQWKLLVALINAKLEPVSVQALRLATGSDQIVSLVRDTNERLKASDMAEQVLIKSCKDKKIEGFYRLSISSLNKT